ncbi:MAG TPA: FtsQ-type POTRA domain-containing protein [Solirubrobacteraceae bacterium]|nr:FtsQ-type POTRA domain-containing protein [Solirubrobacteraceae bacterium]
MLCALLAVPLLGGGWLWLRDSSLVSVRHVQIAGVQGIDSAQIRTALEDAATRMTTLDFNLAALRSAVAQYPIVAGLHVRTGFPHTASIVVTERQPVAALLDSGQRTAVAADGTVLGAAYLSSSLPNVDASAQPLVGARLRESAALAAVGVLAAAPASLERFVMRAYEGPEGLTVAMRTGLLVYFGNATRPHAKWLSLARVLVSSGSAGAIYIDVRLPERPAAGFSSSLPAISSSSTSSSASAAAASASECASACAAGETAATLASRLEASIGVSSTAAAAPSEQSGTGSAGGSASVPAEPSSSGTETGSASAGGESSGPSSGSATGASGAPSEAATSPIAGG